MAATLGASLVQSCLDYVNSILYGTSTSNSHNLQCAQNALAHTVLYTHHDLSSQTRNEALRWLPVRQRIVFKVAVLTYKKHSTPNNLIVCYTPVSLSMLCILHTNFGQRSFSRNLENLPDTVRNSPSLTTFKTSLKSHLFNLVNKYYAQLPSTYGHCPRLRFDFFNYAKLGHRVTGGVCDLILNFATLLVSP